MQVATTDELGCRNQSPGQAYALDGILVVELGDRLAARLSGTLLAQAGADVVAVEYEGSDRLAVDRALLGAGKRRMEVRSLSALPKRLAEIISRADVLILDDRSIWSDAPDPKQVVCNLSAYGSTGPLAGRAASDAIVQALSGIMDVTGESSGAPTLVGLPFLEVSAALYAAIGMVAALRYRDAGGEGQSVEVALYDCAVNAQATFLPFLFAGQTPRRSGNRHSMCSPWGCYKSRDRWILICSATNEQWLRLCSVMNRNDLAADPRLKTLADRVAHFQEVDAAVGQWVGSLTFAQCIEALGAAGIACGPIVPIEALEQEPNLAYRGFMRHLLDPLSGQPLRVPQSPLRDADGLGLAPDSLSLVGSELELSPKIGAEKQTPNSFAKLRAPLSGIRVLEIGQYTTAPLAARHLASLGAEVIKIEPIQGDASRRWPPQKEGESYFFMLSNNDKCAAALDLDNEHGREQFRSLLRSADVFIENARPGSLARRGFGPADLAKLNPGLIYCAISGFGHTSAYPQRPAFDAVIQAMSGMMALTLTNGTPVKAGISVADILGGQFALFAILLAVRRRDKSGQGNFIDIAMQETAAWATQLAWNRRSQLGSPQVLECSDGFVLADASEQTVRSICPNYRDQPAAAVVQALDERAVPAAPILTIAEVAEHPQLAARELIAWRRDDKQVEWPLLGSPIRLSKTPTHVVKPIGPVGADNGYVRKLSGLPG